MILNKIVGENVRILRKKRGWTQTRLAREINKKTKHKKIGKSMISNYENGLGMGAYMFFSICAVFKVDPDEMVKGNAKFSDDEKWCGFPKTLSDFQKRMRKNIKNAVNKNNIRKQDFDHDFDDIAWEFEIFGENDNLAEISSWRYRNKSEILGNLKIERLFVLSQCLNISLKKIVEIRKVRFYEI